MEDIEPIDLGLEVQHKEFETVTHFVLWFDLYLTHFYILIF